MQVPACTREAYLVGRFSRLGLVGVVLAHAAVLLVLMWLPPPSVTRPGAVLSVSLLPLVQAPTPKSAPEPELVPQPAPSQPRPLSQSRLTRLGVTAEAPAPATETVVAIPAPTPTPVEAAPAAPASSAPATAQVSSAPAVASQPRFDADYLDNPKPNYPFISRRMGEEGRVVLRVRVAASGLPVDVQLQASSGSSRLDQSAIDTVRRWRFVPARFGSDAVAATVLVPIAFSLKD